MPKRSNDFQKLVYLVRLNLADAAKVTESKLLRDRLTRKLREVDVCIEGFVGGDSVKVCVECRDHVRVADVTWVEAMKTKHERLPTNLLILASRSGFTSEALKVANIYGIQALKLDEVETADFPAMLGASSSLWVRLINVHAEKVVVRVKRTNACDAKTITDFLEAENVVVMPDNSLYAQDGSEIGAICILVQRMIEAQPCREYLLNNCRPDHVRFHLRWEPPVDDVGRPFFLKKLDPNLLREIQYIQIYGPCELKITEFGLRRGSLGGVHFAWGKSEIMGKPALVVATRDMHGAETLSFTVNNELISLNQAT
jgi:hypothetical protein